MFVTYLFSVATFVPAVTPMSPEPRNPLILHLLPCFVKQKTALEQLFLCGWQSCGIFHSWVDQAEYQEHKYGLPDGTRIGTGMGHTISAVLSPDTCLKNWTFKCPFSDLLFLQISLFLSLFLCFLDYSWKADYWKVTGRFKWIFEGEQIAAGIYSLNFKQKKKCKQPIGKPKLKQTKPKANKQTKLQLTARMGNQPRLPHRLVIPNLTIASLLLVASHCVLKDGNVFGANFHTLGNIRPINNNLLNKSHFTRCDFLKLV